LPIDHYKIVPIDRSMPPKRISGQVSRRTASNKNKPVATAEEKLGMVENCEVIGKFHDDVFLYLNSSELFLCKAVCKEMGLRSEAAAKRIVESVVAKHFNGPHFRIPKNKLTTKKGQSEVDIMEFLTRRRLIVIGGKNSTNDDNYSYEGCLRIDSLQIKRNKRLEGAAVGKKQKISTKKSKADATIYDRIEWAVGETPFLSTYRRHCTACWLKGELFVFGSSFTQYEGTVERIGLLAGSNKKSCILRWTLPHKLTGFTATEFGGTIFLCGGRMLEPPEEGDEDDFPRWSPQDSVYYFKEDPSDPKKATFELLEPVTLTLPRQDHTAVVFRGKVWIAGGRQWNCLAEDLDEFNEVNTDDSIRNTPADPFCAYGVEVINPSDAVPAFVELPTTRRDHANWRLFHSRLLVINDELYCVSFGQSAGHEEGMLVEKLNLETNEWVAVGPVGPAVRTARGINAGALGSTIFVFDFEKWISFDVTSQSWHGPNPAALDKYLQWGPLPPGRSGFRDGTVISTPPMTW
jgi:hypothetical protein